MRIGVIFGGKSEEHEVSRNSARNVLKALAGTEHELLKAGITKEGRWYVTEASPDEIADGSWEQHPSNRQAVVPSDPVVHGFLIFDEKDHARPYRVDCIFPVLHGDYGEDGRIQGVFEMADIPYVGPDVKASANCMDKSVTKKLAAATGVTQARYAVLKRREFLRDPEGTLAKAVDSLGGEFPVFVKPSSAGSSVGASKVKTKEDLEAAVREAFRHDSKVLVEELITGRELEVAVLGNHEPEASCVGEILAAGEFYDYDAKYNNPDSQTRIVDDLPEEVLNEIRSWAVRLYKALECRGMSRVDFFYSDDGRIVFNEINTLPGFTNISMYPKLWEAMGVSQTELVERLIALAVEE